MYAIDKLWKTGFDPSERRIKRDSEYAKIRTAATQEENKFWSELSEDGRRAFDRYCYLESDLTTISECDAFVQGFRFGARIILDVIGEYDTDMPQMCGFV